MELPGGNYKVLFRLKVSDNTKSEPIAKLYVKATRAGSERELASFTLRPVHFSRAGAWEVFELPVEIRDDDINVKIGVEFYGGVADLWCDWIRAVPAGTAVAGDLRVLGSGRFDSFLARRFLDYPEELVNEGDVGLTSFVSMAGGTAYVVAFEDGTVVYVNGLPEGSINAGERLSLSLSAGDIVSANKPIMLHSTSERHVPVTWKFTRFVIPFYRNDPQIIYIFAPDADASVSIYIGPSSSPSTTVSVAKGTVETVSLNVSPPKAVILESDAPILVAVASKNGSHDIRFIHPPEKELIGTPSTYFYVAALEDDTVIEWHQKDKSGTYKLNRGEMVRHAELGISSGGQYNAWPVRAIANKPVMISSFADGDGCDATCGLPPRALPTKMVLPVNAQWLSIAAPYPETTILSLIHISEPTRPY